MRVQPSLCGVMRYSHRRNGEIRTASNSNKLEHLKKQGKRSPKRYELRGMVEVDRTRTNFDTMFLGGWTIAKRKRRFLNRRTRRSRSKENRLRPSVGNLCRVGRPLAQQDHAIFNPVADVKDFGKKSLTTDNLMGTDKRR